MKRDRLEDVYRLSPVQEGMLFHGLHAEGGGVFLQQFAFAVEGELEPAALVRAFQETVDRHPALRTAFVWERAGRPLQVVVRQAELPVTTERWPAMPAAEEPAALADLLRRDRQRGLEVGEPPLLRLTLVEAEAEAGGGGGVRYLLWTYHHAILDGWSMGRVLGEVLARYRAHDGGPPFERRPPRPFRDYIAWLDRQDLGAAETYWRRILAGFDPVPLLPAEGSAGEVAGEADGKRTLVLPADLRSRLAARAQRSGLTLNTLAQGAWALLLGRAGDRGEVAFGAVVSGRPAELAGVEEMIGLFINTLPTRVRIAPGQRLGDWLLELQAAQLEMRRYEYSPLPRVQAWSGAAAGRPLFETILVFENRALFAAGDGGPAGAGPRLRSVEYRGEPGYPLVAIVEPGEGLALTLAYDRRRFAPGTVERWLEQLAALLESMGDDLDRPVASLASLSAAERRQLLPAGGSVPAAAAPPPDLGRPDLPRPYVAPRDPRERRLAEIWGEVLGVARVGIHDNFFALGGDSILILKVVARARKAGLALTSRQLYDHTTLAALAATVGGAVPARAAPVAAAGEVPLTPIQRWFFERVETDPQHWNQAVLIAARQRLVPAWLARAVGEILAHHDALRLRFVSTPEGWRQLHSAAPAAVPFVHLDLSGLPEARRSAALAAAAAAIQTTLHLEQGPLLRFALSTFGDGAPARLLAVAHHLVIDSVSWRVLFEDLTTAYEQVARGAAPQLPPKTTSFQEWAERLLAHAQTPAVAAELDFWLEGRPAAVEPLPRDRPAGRNSEGTRRTVTVGLSADETAILLRELPRVYGTRIDDALLTAVALAFRAWTGRPRLLLDLEGHGREELFADVDLSRTVGWFTALYPVLLEVAEPAGEVEALRAVQAQLRRIPYRGIGYGLLCYLHADPGVRQRLRALPRAEVVFNYLGQFAGGGDGSAAWGPAPEPTGPQRGRRGERLHLFELNGNVADGRLSFDWSYSAELHDRATVERLAGDFLARLRQLVDRCAAGAPGPFPADFPLARVDPATLDRLGGPAIEDLYPLSPMQQGMLFDSLHDAGGAYVTQLSWEARGAIDRAAFAAAWRRVIERHPALRTAFAWEGCDRPLQVVCRDLPLPLAEEDWRGLDGEEQQRRLELLARRRQSFDLTRGPLLAFDLVRLADRAWRFLWTFHHLVLDGWSTPIVLMEFGALYRAARRGEELKLPARRPFRDYIAWLAERDLAAAERYFRRALAGYAGAPPLRPLLRPPELRRPGESYGDVGRLLAAPPTADLQAFARRHHLTLNVLVQGAWALLLSRLGESADVVLGVTVAGRPAGLAGVEEMVGMFINTLPVRLRIPAAGTLVAWLKEHQERHADLLEYAYAPLAQIQQWSLPAGAALFESIVVFENYPDPFGAAEEGSDDLTWSGFRYWIRESFPLILVVGPGAELSLHLKHDAGLYRSAALADLLADLEALLLCFLAAPEAPLDSAVAWLDARLAERRARLRQEIQETRHERFLKATRRRGEPAPLGAAGEGDGR